MPRQILHGHIDFPITSLHNLVMKVLSLKAVAFNKNCVVFIVKKEILHTRLFI